MDSGAPIHGGRISIATRPSDTQSTGAALLAMHYWKLIRDTDSRPKIQSTYSYGYAIMNGIRDRLQTELKIKLRMSRRIYFNGSSYEKLCGIVMCYPFKIWIGVHRNELIVFINSTGMYYNNSIRHMHFLGSFELADPRCIDVIYNRVKKIIKTIMQLKRQLR